MSENNQNTQDLRDAITEGNKSDVTSIDSGKETGKWLEGLPDDLRGVKSLSKFNDLTSLAKSYIELEKNLDKRIIMPGDEASDEDWGKLFIKLGMPEDKKYITDEKKAELLKNNLTDGETLSLYEELFHKGNLTKRQGEKILNQIIENAQNTNEELIKVQKASREANMAKFYEVYKDQTSEKLNILKGVMSKYGSAELVDLVEETNYAPVLIDLLLKLGEGIKSDSLVSGKSEPTISDKETAVKEIKRLESDKEFMLKYADRSHIGHKQAVSELNDLYEIAYKK
jgi:polyhydroxyalkanoate synthesis regulator phasin